MAASTNLTPEQRSQRSRIGAHARWSKEHDRKANAERAQAGLFAKFEREVDPDNILSPQERRLRAKSAHRAHMARLAYNSSKARVARRAAKTEVVPTVGPLAPEGP